MSKQNKKLIFGSEFFTSEILVLGDGELVINFY